MGTFSGAISDCSVEDVIELFSGHEPSTRASERADRHAAVAMVLTEGASGALEVLLIQRAEHPDDPWSGQMAFPGGRREPEDACLVAVALRETAEEVGLVLDEQMLLGRLDDVEGGRLLEQRLVVTPFVFYCPKAMDLEPNYEVAATVWFPLEHLSDSTRVQPYVFPLDPAKREFPSFVFQGYTVWGLTYRIIADFVRLFGASLPGEPQLRDVE